MNFWMTLSVYVFQTTSGVSSISMSFKYFKPHKDKFINEFSICLCLLVFEWDKVFKYFKP